MSKKKITITHHAKARMKTRAIADNSFVVAAMHKGIDVYSLPRGELKDYLLSRANRRHKRVKVYKGWVFVWLNTSNRLITCYPIKEKYKKEYDDYISKCTRRQKIGLVSNKTTRDIQNTRQTKKRVYARF